QSFGTPMGSPISPVIADLVLRRLETVSLMSVNLDILFYYRYVDDICTALPPSQIDVLLERFNAFHPRLQFTVERGGKTINFLDVTVSVNNNRFNFDWYRKPTFSDEEPSYRKRLISEMLHIKKQKNSLNLQTDTEGLNKAYLAIINSLTSTITSLSLSWVFTPVMHCGGSHFLFGCV
ncbi:PREDICTED: uncharacterized protein LOC108754896, partial [Trachymyrmex septentrionalis]|uniref:uncharacterized protein LOC108754896 n=1 Tax=Trachymyrmex septentrionalis TaxID=34720 RepID=UPI00084F5346